MLNPRHQAQATDANQVPDVSDVGLKRLDRSPQGVDIDRIDQHRLSLEQVSRHRPTPVEQVVVPDIAQLKVADNMGHPGRRGPGCRGQDQDVVPSLAEGIDHLLAPQLIPADHVGRVEVRDDQDLHRGVTLNSSTGGFLYQDLGQLFRQEGHPVRLGGGPRAGLGSRGDPAQGRFDLGNLRPEVEVAADHGGGPPSEGFEVNRPVQDRYE